MRGIIVGGITLLLLMGCNNGLSEELAVEKRLGEIGRSAENVFYSFIDLIAGTLGFRVTKDTKKSEVGDHFNKLGIKIGEASEGLEQVAKKAETGDDRSDSSKKLIREAVEAAKGVLGKLKGHVESLGKVGDGNVVGWAASSSAGAAANDGELKKIYDVLKGIVGIATKQQVKEPSASSVTLQASSIGVATPEDGAKILATGGGAPAAGDAGKATAIVAAVSGEEILDSIVKSKDGDESKGVAVQATGDTTAVAFAKGSGTPGNLTRGEAKAAAVAGGIALRSLIKEGKLGAHNTNSDDKAAQAAGVTAVNKLLVAVEDIIKKTVKNILETAKQKIDEARNSKAVGNK